MSDYLEPIIFGLAMAFPVVFFPIMLIKWPKIGLGMLAGYLIIYIPFTVAGRYVVANHGGNDWGEDWLPKYMMFEYQSPSGRTKSDLTTLGAVYWPCILADNLLWHRSSGDDRSIGG
jgi:hypothetical protein